MRTRTSVAAETLSARLLVHRQQAGSFPSDYRRAAEEFPALLQACGLATAWAFAEHRKIKPPKATQGDGAPENDAPDPWREYLSDLHAGLSNPQPVDKFAQSFSSPDNREYWRVSREVIAAADLIKRMATALLPDPPAKAGPNTAREPAAPSA